MSAMSCHRHRPWGTEDRVLIIVDDQSFVVFNFFLKMLKLQLIK